MVCLLDAHRDQARNIRYETPFETTPAISTETYLDTFGNHVRRFIAPAGDLTIRRDAIVEDSGQPDPVKLDAEEIAVERLPNDTLVFTLGSRYCETDKLCDIAWQLFDRDLLRLELDRIRPAAILDNGVAANRQITRGRDKPANMIAERVEISLRRNCWGGLERCLAADISRLIAMRVEQTKHQCRLRAIERQFIAISYEHD